MTQKLSVRRFRLEKPAVAPVPALDSAAAMPPEALFEQADDGFGDASFTTAAPAAADPTDLDAIGREGLTGRQLRLARRMAERNNLTATSDLDAVRQLRLAGIDPFERRDGLELVTDDTRPRDGPQPTTSRALLVRSDGASLPGTVRQPLLPSTDTREPFGDIRAIQRDMMRRRRRRLAMLAARMIVFVLLPTVAAGLYYAIWATPLYATKTEFVIQQAESPVAAGMGGLLRGTTFATSQDSIAVQGYLQSREAMARLDDDIGFRAHFSRTKIDPIQRLDPDATAEAAYRVYKRNVHIAYDPTEGIVKMEVIAADPQVSVAMSQALISYAEEQVDHLTSRMRADQMAGAQEIYESAETDMQAAQRRVVDLQQRTRVLSSEAEVGLITAQIGALDTQLTTDRLSLEQMLSNAEPNQARMDPLKRRIATVEAEIASLRGRMTQDGENGPSLAQVQSDLLVAQADVQTRQMLLSQSLTAMETARVEANRQTRYLSVSVNPVAPDETTYPRAFENTVVALLVFTGIYLMVAMTVAILREQVSA